MLPEPSERQTTSPWGTGSVAETISLPQTPPLTNSLSSSTLFFQHPANVGISSEPVTDPSPTPEPNPTLDPNAEPAPTPEFGPIPMPAPTPDPDPSPQPTPDFPYPFPGPGGPFDPGNLRAPQPPGPVIDVPPVEVPSAPFDPPDIIEEPDPEDYPETPEIEVSDAGNVARAAET